MGEVYLPAAQVTPYLEQLDAAFAFELFHAPWDAGALRAAIAASGERAAWVLSNHDFPRLPDRFGRENVRAAAMLLLTLPGMAFVYQGEEIGQGDGPPGPVADARQFDRAGRDRFRHPLQWTADPRTAGFTNGDPWLPPVDPAERNVAGQEAEPGLAARAVPRADRAAAEARPGAGAARRRAGRRQVRARGGHGHDRHVAPR